MIFERPPHRERPSWYYTPLGILVLTLLVLGPLALPLIWKTPAWGPRGKWIATALLVVYTVALGWLVWIDVQFALRHMQP
jgi:hypothetical protein